MEARDPAPKAGQFVRFLHVPEGREVPEIVLLRRRHPLIDLALARFGSTPSVIRRVYHRGGGGVRCAALKNPFAGGGEFTAAGGLQWMQEEDVQALVAAGMSPELRAFCENPHLGDNVYQDLLLRRNHFGKFDDTTYAFILRQLGRNARLATPYGSIYYDGWDEVSYDNVFDAAWSLAGTLPADRVWASVLHDLLARCVHPRGMLNIEPLLERWRIESKEDAQSKYGDSTIWLRTCLAGLLNVDRTMLTSDDPALKASFYRRFSPATLPDWPDRLLADGERFYSSAVLNESIWRDPGERERLRELAWNLPDPHADMDYQNDFLSHAARNRELHPAWFVDKDEDNLDGHL